MTRLRTIFSAALVASGPVLAAAPAHAEDDPTYTPQEGAGVDATPSSIVRAKLTVAAPSYVIQAAACALPVIATGSRVRPFDVRIEGQRCASTPVPNDAIPLVVHVGLVDGSQQVVVLEADSNGTETESVRAGITVVGDLLKKKIADGSAPITTVAHQERSELQPLSPGLRDTGKITFALGAATACVGVVLGVVALLGGLQTYDAAWNSFGTVAGVTLGVGLGAMALGGTLWIIGGVKVSRVVASISPTGGTLRVTF